MHDCLPWHADVIRDDTDMFVREWHAIDCPQFKSLLIQNDQPHGHRGSRS